MDGLSTAEQKAEIIEWFDAAAEHYPDLPMIDVVNEAYMSNPNDMNAGKHAPIPYRDALGGAGATGFDWIVESFKMARARWPKAILIYNDYNTLEWGNEITWIKQIIPKLVAAGAPIDGVGFQAHGLKGTSAATLQSRLDDIWESIQLPMYITEYDIGETNDQAQLDNYKAHITTMWNHPKVVGITVWGYIYGSTWVNGTGIINNGTERPAMTWLKDFIKSNLNPPNDYPDLLGGGGVSKYRLTVNARGQGSVTRGPDSSSYAVDAKVTLTATANEGWVFSSWSDGATGDTNPLTVTMDAAKTITAIFKTTDGKEDLVVNGTFSGAEPWAFNNWGGTGDGTVENGEYKITISSAGDNYYDLQVVQSGITLEKGKAYRLIFDASASAERVMNVNVGMPADPYTSFLTSFNGIRDVDLTATKKTYSLDFNMEAETYSDSRIEFSVGTSTPTVNIDNVSLFEITPFVSILPSQKKTSKQLHVYRNGSRITINFATDFKSATFLNVYNLKGKVIHSVNCKADVDAAQTYSFNTAGMSKGYYIVKVSNGKSILKSGFVLTGR